ncbi:MAG TPA: TetR/AcrR family transcriptional regulator [Steroidobacteraceae bacterium]|jgi:AcrR family transcriptional regulator
MSRKRLTRAESRDMTRRRLLDAGAVVIARHGLKGASVEDIAAHAGYTRGAFHSNFRSKVDLFIELLKRDHEDIQQGLQGIMESGLPTHDLQRQLQNFYSQLYRGSISYVLWAEARLQGLRDARFRARLSALLLQKRDMIAHFIRRFYQISGHTAPAPAGDLAFTTMALIDGMRFFNACMPEALPDKNMQSVLGTVFSATFFD